MTMVHIRLRAPTNGGTRAGVGMVVFQPSARHTDDASVVLPDTFTVVLDEEGEATVDIQPTGPEWCWKTDEQVPYGSIRWFTVPDTAGTLEYAELTTWTRARSNRDATSPHGRPSPATSKP